MKEGVTVFGEYLREMLMEKRMSLRELSRRSKIDVSNLSKMERGVVYPPQKRQTLIKIASAIELDEQQKQRLIELAALVNGMVPVDLSHVKKNKAIPLLLRAINNKKLGEEQVEKLARLVEQENSWQGRVVD